MKIGSFWINLQFESENDYKKGIEGFIFHSKNIFLLLESEHTDLCEEMIRLEEVDLLFKQGRSLQNKIAESIKNGLVEFQLEMDTNRKELLLNHDLLNVFLGGANIKLLLEKMN